MAKFLEYVPGESFLHRMNPCVKLIGAVLIAIACFVTSNLVFLLILLAAALVMAASCGLGRETAGLCKAVFAFSLILAVVILLTTPHGMPLVPLPWGYIGTGSLLAALTVVVRLMAAAIPLFLVFYVTKMNDLTNAAVKQLHVPYKYAFTFTSTVQDQQRRHRRGGARLQPAHAHERLQGLSAAWRGLHRHRRVRARAGRRHRAGGGGVGTGGGWPTAARTACGLRRPVACGRPGAGWPAGPRRPRRRLWPREAR